MIGTTQALRAVALVRAAAPAERVAAVPVGLERAERAVAHRAANRRAAVPGDLDAPGGARAQPGDHAARSASMARA